MKGESVSDTEFEINSSQKVDITNGTTLVSKDGVWYANGREYTTPEAAQAALQ